jgi:hypothetical protein
MNNYNDRMRPYIYSGTPLSSPVFTLERVSTKESSQENFLAVYSGSLYFWAARNAFNVDAEDLNRLSFWINDGSSWSGEYVYHDEYANPTSGLGDPSLQYLHGGINATVLSTGLWGVVFALEYVSGGFQYCAGFYMSANATAPIVEGGESAEVGSAPIECYLVIQKHPDAILDVPIDFTKWLEDGDSVVSATMSPIGGLSVSSTLIVGAIVTAVGVSGGTLGESSYLKCTVMTQGGRIEARHVEVRVENCLIDSQRVGLADFTETPVGILDGAFVPGIPYRGVGGPFIYQDKIYGLFGNGLQYDEPERLFGPEVWRSLDGGATWSAMNSKTLTEWKTYGYGGAGSNSWSRQVASVQYGSKIYICWHNADDNVLQISTFDMTTDQWTIDVSSAGPTSSALESLATRYPIIDMSVRSDGTLVIIYPVWETLRTSVYAVTWESTASWGTPVVVAQNDGSIHYGPVQVVVDSSDDAHAFISHRANSTPSTASYSNMYHVTFKADDSVVGLQQIKDQVTLSVENVYGIPSVGTYNSIETLAIATQRPNCNARGLGIGFACDSFYYYTPLAALGGNYPYCRKPYQFSATVADTPSWTTESVYSEIPSPLYENYYWIDGFIPQVPNVTSAGFFEGLTGYVNFFHNDRLYFIYGTSEPEATKSFLWGFYKDPITGWSDAYLIRQLEGETKYGSPGYIQLAPYVAPYNDGIAAFLFIYDTTTPSIRPNPNELDARVEFVYFSAATLNW